MSNLLSSLSPFDSSSLWESLLSTVYYRTWDVPCKPEHFSFSFFLHLPEFTGATPLAPTQAAYPAERASAGRQPFPSSPALSSRSTNPFSFLGVQSSGSRGLSGREAAVGCLLGGRKGLWGSQDVGGNVALGNLLREKENLAILEICWEG